MIFVLDSEDNTLATLSNSSPDACPYWNDVHLENLNDSLSTYTFEVPLQHEYSEFLIGDNYVAVADMDGDFILFKIKNVAESFSNGVYTKKVFCENAAVAELNGHILRPNVLSGYSAEDAVYYVLNGSGWERGDVDFLGAKDFNFESYQTGIAALQEIATAFGGELVYRLTRNRLTGNIRRYVDLKERRGRDTGKRFEYEKDIDGLVRTQDTTELATALIGVGSADENGVRLTFAKINDNQDWVGDDDALDRYGVNGRHVFGVFEWAEADTAEVLLSETKKELKRRKRPSMTYDVSVLLLETLADWSHEEVRLGDTVRVLDLTFTPELALSARIVSLSRSYTDPTQDRAILGEYKALKLSVPAIVKQMQKKLVSNTGLLKGREPLMHIGPVPPTELDRKWMDTSVTPNVLKRWDGSEWVAAGGEQGPEGPAGPTLYTWIKYADDAQGNGLSNTPYGKPYIGIAYNRDTPSESTNPSYYTWSLMKGTDGATGTPGPAGVDGRTPYLHIAYANNKAGTLDFTVTEPDNHLYIGTYTDYLFDDSLDPSDYKWLRVKGDTGEKGPQGTSNFMYIRYSANADGNPMTAKPETNSRFIGVVTTTATSAPPAYSDYTWSLYQGPQGVQGLQGIQGPQGAQGVKGTPGENGVSSYTHIAYATGTAGQNFSTSHFSTATYIGIYVDYQIEDSTNYSDYKWTLIKGADGTQGLPGPKGEDGLTPYFHTAWANNATGTSGFSTTVSVGRTYIGTYTDYVAEDSETPSKYNWVLIQGPQGIQGIQGIQGPAGANGESLYTWVKYADTPVSGMTDVPAGKTYIGLAYNKTTPTESNNYDDYTWSLIKGDQGVEGPAGPDGESLYTWIKYASTPTSGMSDSPAGRKYMGIAYNKATQTESTDYADYEWSLIEGPQGPQGPKGDTGLQGVEGLQGPKGDQGIQGPVGQNGVSSYTHIAYASGTSGQNFSTSHYSAATYIGIYVDNTAADSTDYTKYKWSLIKGADGAQGIQGPKGADGLTPYFHTAWATNATGTTGFSTTDSTNKTYIGVYTDNTSADSTDPSKYAWTLIKGDKGDTGATGAQGPKGDAGPQGLQGLQGPQGNQGIKGADGADGTSSYTHIAYATGTAGQNFSTSHFANATYIGIYVDSTPNDSTNYAKYAWSLIKGADGAQGIQGPRGSDGSTPYFHTAWANNSSGTSGFSTTVATGKTYIGTYTDYISADSTDPSKYTWVLIKGETGATGATGPQGPQGIQGPAGANGTSQYVHIRYSAASNGNPMTTSPGSTTAYIGVASTSSSTAPSNYSSYTWSLFKGPQGNTGVQGPAGQNGVTTYTWVKYADDENGNGLSDTPAGKRYIGLAFNKTTQTESSNKADYLWSPLYDNVQVGGRNLYFNSSEAWYTKQMNSYNAGYQFLPLEDMGLVTGDVVTWSFDIDNPATNDSGAIPRISFYREDNTYSVVYNSDYVMPGQVGRRSVTAVIPADCVKINLMAQRTNASATAASFDYLTRKEMFEKGNVPTDWTPAPEDIDDKINSKVDQDDMDSLAEIVATVSSELNLKAGASELQAMQLAYNERVEQDILDKQQLSTSLSTIEGRMTLAETIAGENKLVTSFIETVITESEEGIFISNQGNSTGILITDDRISFVDGTTEVAYISNQTMQINHGIFVESATIAKFKFELIPGTEILAIQWVGDI